MSEQFLKSPKDLALAATFLIAPTFALDPLLAWGEAVCVLYVAPVLLSLWTGRRRYTLIIAAVVSVLTGIGYFLTPDKPRMAAEIFGRGIALLGIWVAAIIVLAYQRVERRLATTLRREQGLREVTGVIILGLDTEGRITEINRYGEEVIGCPEARCLGDDWFDRFVPERMREKTREFALQVARGETPLPPPFENPILSAGGEERLVLWNSETLYDEGGRPIGLIASGTDVTGLRKHEGALARARRQRLDSEARLEMSRKELADIKYALDQSAIVARTDVKGKITYVNDKFCEISKYSREELLGRDHRIINSGHHSKEFMRDLWQTILTGETWRGEIRNRAKDGEPYWVDTTIVPFIDESGKPYQFIAIRSDITARVQAEIRLREQEALAHLGEMATVIAHEVKNPLAGISGALQIILRRIGPEAAEAQVIRDILDRIASLNSSVQDLLLYARPRVLNRRVVELHDLLRDSARLVKADEETAEIEVEIAGEPIQRSVDPEMMREVLLNLLINAAQAMSGKGKIKVRTEKIGAGGCRLSITDEGPGMPAEIRARAFDPFFTTKARGTGLGLALAKRVIEQHGGEIAVECPPGGGTSVVLTWTGATDPAPA